MEDMALTTSVKLSWESKPINTNCTYIEGLKPPGAIGRFRFNRERKFLEAFLGKEVKVFGIKHSLNHSKFMTVRKAVIIDRDGKLIAACDHINIKSSLNINNMTPISFVGCVISYKKKGKTFYAVEPKNLEL